MLLHGLGKDSISSECQLSSEDRGDDRFDGRKRRFSDTRVGGPETRIRQWDEHATAGGAAHDLVLGDDAGTEDVACTTRAFHMRGIAGRPEVSALIGDPSQSRGSFAGMISIELAAVEPHPVAYGADIQTDTAVALLAHLTATSRTIHGPSRVKARGNEIRWRSRGSGVRGAATGEHTATWEGTAPAFPGQRERRFSGPPAHGGGG